MYFSAANSTGNSTRRLNPTAQVFVPRSMMSSPNSNSAYSASPHATSNSSSTNNHSMANGTIQSSSILEGENDIEDYVALSYLKEFISSISNKPSIYDMGISEITCIVNSYLDEDECVLELIVNQIVDQVWFCIQHTHTHCSPLTLIFSPSSTSISGTMESVSVSILWKTLGQQALAKHLRLSCSRGMQIICKLFIHRLKQFFSLFSRRCQRECSRKVNKTTSANTFNHLRGLALFAADLFSRSKAAPLAENLPNLLISILSTNTKLDENVKCVCQVLKVWYRMIKLHDSSL